MTKRASAPFLGIDSSVFTVGAVSLVIMAFAADRADRWLAIAGAVVFSARMISSALNALQKLPARAVVRQSSRYSALSMAWAAASLWIAYPIIGLRWQHGWQYGLGAAVLAALFLWYSERFNAASDAPEAPGELLPARIVSAVLAIAISIAAVWLIWSGKLMTEKNDWLANDVFLAIGTIVFTMCLSTIFRAR